MVGYIDAFQDDSQDIVVAQVDHLIIRPISPAALMNPATKR